jgi:2'-5' RNA ligase
LRREHFPAERNHLAAHVTLFHAVPGERHVQVDRDLTSVASARPAFDLEVARVRLFGRGVAYDLLAPEADALRADLVERWEPWLTPQDRHRLRPHVTVQNKVDPAVARALHTELAAAFVPWSVRAQGLALFRYLGGPWDPLSSYDFPSS